jgi:hypothetical protein
MAVPDAVLVGRARRAYEWGRVRTALRTAAVVAPMVALSLVVCRQYAATAACGSALAAAVLAAAWRGQQLARGMRAGLVAGLVPLLLPLGTCLHLCAGGVCLLAPAVCVGAGIAGGVAIGVLARRRADADAHPARYLLPALIVAALTGSLGCVIAGASGVLGMALGMGIGAAPILWWRARAA